MLSISQVVRSLAHMTWELTLRELYFLSLVKRKLRGSSAKTYRYLMGSFKACGVRLFPRVVDYEVQRSLFLGRFRIDQ